MTLWYIRSSDNQASEGEISTHIRVPADSPWFEGHFPGAPVLPGVAQLGMVHDLLCRRFGRQLPVAQVSRVRFKQMIRPGQGLTLTVKTGDAGDSHNFRLVGDDGLICSGLMRLAAKKQ